MSQMVIGVTGHRNLRPSGMDILSRLVRQQLTELLTECTEPPLLLSSLAEGADQLCAWEGLSLGYRLLVPLPMERERYLREFQPAGRAAFERLIKQADRIFVVNPLEEGSVDEDGFCYRQAGLYVASHCDILLALWDGEEILYPEGGGTYETVDFLLRGYKRTHQGRLLHLVSPRSELPIEDEYTIRF